VTSAASASSRELAVGASPIAQVVVTGDDIVALINQQADQLFGLSHRDAGRFPMVDVRPMLGSALVDPLFTTKMEVSAVNRRGREINVQLVCSALRTAEGTPQGAILVMEQRE
jgi:two-component system CheB/CheR fusion protein